MNTDECKPPYYFLIVQLILCNSAGCPHSSVCPYLCSGTEVAMKEVRILNPSHTEILTDVDSSDQREHESHTQIGAEAFLYQCSNCGKTHLSTSLLDSNHVVHNCSTVNQSVGNQPSGVLEIIGWGSAEKLALWQHSLNLNLDNPFRGI